MPFQQHQIKRRALLAHRLAVYAVIENKVTLRKEYPERNGQSAIAIHHNRQVFHDRDGIHDREILPLVAQTLDSDDPRTWYASLMDYGVFLKSLHPNPGRRSAHHTRQSPFKGSNRELRSRILRAILDGPVMTGGELAATLNAPPAQVLRNLERLEREGFLSRTDDRFAVRH